MDKDYLKIGNAKDIKNPKERIIYRTLEILPGALAWVTLFGVIFLSWFRPVWIAFFIIAFDIYWLLKTVYLSLHLRATYKKMRQHLKIDWLEELKKKYGHELLPEQVAEGDASKAIESNPSTSARSAGLRSGNKNWQDIYHLIILPFYKEPFEVLDLTLEAILKANYPKDKIIVVLATEERGGETARKITGQIRQKYGNNFFKFLVFFHPADIVGELAGKGSNATWAAKQAKKEIIDRLAIPEQNIIVSNFDIDTRVYPDYFGCLSYHFLTTQKPFQSSYQPIPIYNNNIWQAPALSRVVATSGTFWHMMQQERPERLATFSSHSMSFKALKEMDFWNTKNVSEDSRIFWKSLLFYDGDYSVIPLYYPVSMDANLAESFFKTMKNVYRQQRRWGWGVENISYLIFGCLKNKKMPLTKKIRHIFNHLEGFWSWATNALIIFMLGWLPLFLGGKEFNLTVLSYNLPRLTRWIMTLAMIGLVSSAIYSTILLPPRPANQPSHKYFYMIFQWLFLPLTILVFGALPGLEAQTRLMLGKYMGFWVTPKAAPKDQL